MFTSFIHRWRKIKNIHVHCAWKLRGMIDMHADKFHTYQYLWTNRRKKPPKQLTITSNVKSELCIVQLLTTKIVLFWQKHETLILPGSPGSSVFYLVSRAFVAIVQRKPAQVAAQRMEAGGGGASAGLPVEWRVPDWGIGAWTVAMETNAKKHWRECVPFVSSPIRSQAPLCRLDAFSKLFYYFLEQVETSPVNEQLQKNFPALFMQHLKRKMCNGKNIFEQTRFSSYYSYIRHIRAAINFPDLAL